MPPLTLKSLDRSTLIEEELHDLKLRFELLEGDRKAYYETSQWAIRQNKDLIGRLKVQNKELRDVITKLKKQEGDLSAQQYYLSQLEKNDARLCEQYKRYDELKAFSKEKKYKLEQLAGQLTLMLRDSNGVLSSILVNDGSNKNASAGSSNILSSVGIDPNAVKTQTSARADSSTIREIRLLENRLDKAMIKYNEAQSVKRTYEEIVKRLQEDRLSFDNQIIHFERTLKSKKTEVLELELLCRDANHAKELAKDELARLEQQIAEERKVREKESLAKREMVRAKREENANLEKLPKSTEEQPEVQLNQRLGELHAKEQQNNPEREKRLREYEDLMRTLKDAMGVIQIQDVVEKFRAQSETREHLEQLQRQNELYLSQVRERQKQILLQFDELKFTGESKHGQSQRMLEDFEKHLSEAKIRVADAKAKHDRVQLVLADLKTGVHHLMDRLGSIPILSGKGESIQGSDENDLVSLLERCSSKIDVLHNNIKDKEIVSDVSDDRLLQFPQAMLPQYNMRIKLRPNEFEKNIDDDDENLDDEIAEVPDRDTLKKFTIQMINSRVKTKQPKKKPKKKAVQDSSTDIDE